MTEWGKDEGKPFIPEERLNGRRNADDKVGFPSGELRLKEGVGRTVDAGHPGPQARSSGGAGLLIFSRPPNDDG